MTNQSRRVYSTEGNNVCPGCGKALHKCRCSESAAEKTSGDGILLVQRESKGRGGKQVTVISGFDEDIQQLKKLLKQVKARCGTGGTVKGQVLEIQGDHRDEVVTILQAMNYSVKRSGG